MDSTTTTTTSLQGLNGRLAFAIFAAVFGSAFQHGYNTGVVNPPADIMKNWIGNLSISSGDDQAAAFKSRETIWAIAVSIFCLGGMIGGSLVGWGAERLGRKGALLFNNVFVVLTVIFQSSAKIADSCAMFIAGRLLIGINSGLNAGLVPMYLSEVSPMNLRGAVGSAYQLIITMSILFANVMGMDSLLGTPRQWPWLFAITIIPAIFQLLTLPFCPETPKYLMLNKGQDMESKKALTWLRNTMDVQEEMEEIRAECESAKLMPQVTMRELVFNPSLRMPLIVALMIMLAQQLSGINAVMFFSTTIFTSAGLDTAQAQKATLVVGVVNVLMTFVSLVLVEKSGRKTLLLFGFVGITITTTLLALSLPHAAKSIVVSYLSVFLVVLFIVFFASGPGSIPWFLVSELFNQSARPAAASIAVSINWTANFFVGIGFPLISELIGSNVFYVFVALQLFFTLFIWKKVPETKNKTVEEISSMFRQRSYK